MNISTLFHQCIYISIIILIFTLCANFMSVFMFQSHAIPVPINMGKAPATGTDATNQTFISMVEGITGLSSLWLLGLGVGTLAAGALSILTRQTTPIAAYLFGAVFWTSYIRCLSVFAAYVPSSITILFTVSITFLFAGAIIGIFGYSG